MLELKGNQGWCPDTSKHCAVLRNLRVSGLLPLLPPTPRPSSVSGNETVSRICPGSQLRMCNTSQRLEHPVCVFCCQFWRDSPQPIVGSSCRVECQQQPCNTSTICGIRSNKRVCSCPFWCNCAAACCGWPIGTPWPFKPCLETSERGISSPHHGFGVSHPSSSRQYVCNWGLGNLRCSRSSSCLDAPACLSAPTSPLQQQIHSPDPGRRTDDVNIVRKGKQSFTFQE